MSRGPNVGDIIMVKPIRVSKSGRVLGTNPTNYGNHVFIENNENLEEILPDEILRAIKKGRSPFHIRCFDDSIPAEVVSLQDGSVIATVILEESHEKDEEASSTFESPERDEPIEWKGTPQEINPDKTKDRERVFNEEDRRGSKNDLL
jgi:hypothetical protein